MEDTAKIKEQAVLLAEFIEEHKCGNVLALYVGNVSSWTDYFIIGTVTSSGHMRGVLRHLKGFMPQYGLHAANRQKKIEPDNGWVLLDCGCVVVHLMTEEQRSFYELEKLWFNGETVYQSS